MIDGDSTYEDGLGDIHSCRLGDLRLGLTRMRVTFVSLVSEGVCDACCLRVYVCVGGYVLGYELVICICIQDNINIVHNQFGSANQRYCALPHHSSTFGLTLRCLTKEVVHSIWFKYCRIPVRCITTTPKSTWSWPSPKCTGWICVSMAATASLWGLLPAALKIVRLCLWAGVGWEHLRALSSESELIKGALCANVLLRMFLLFNMY